MTTETKRDLHADLALCEAATEGPWRYGGDKWGDLVVYSSEKRGFHNNGGEIAEIDGPNEVNNAKFITESRTGWPHAIERALSAEMKWEQLREIVRTNATGHVRGDDINEWDVMLNVMDDIDSGEELANE